MKYEFLRYDILNTPRCSRDEASNSYDTLSTPPVTYHTSDTTLHDSVMNFCVGKNVCEIWNSSRTKTLDGGACCVQALRRPLSPAASVRFQLPSPPASVRASSSHRQLLSPPVPFTASSFHHQLFRRQLFSAPALLPPASIRR